LFLVASSGELNPKEIKNSYKQITINMEELIEQLKQQLIEELNLEEISPADIDAEAPLFGDDGLGLDSIDALEIILILERNYCIKIENPAQGKEIFYSVRTLANYIRENRK
jgi:acyl carrier protein